MKIKIENYLRNKRDQLDVEEPDSAMLWEGIRKDILLEKKSHQINLWKIAAIFLVIFTLSYIVYNEVGKEKEREFTLSQINKSLGEREEEYKKMISLKMQDVNIQELTTNSEYDILPILVNELNELDTIYAGAISDLKQHGYLEQIVDIIFDTYEKRMRILEQIIMETQKIEKYENREQQISI